MSEYEKISLESRINYDAKFYEGLNTAGEGEGKGCYKHGEISPNLIPTKYP